MEGRLRVLMIDSERTWRGGEAQLALLMRGLREEDGGLSVTLAAHPEAAITAKAAALGVPCAPLPMGGGTDVRAAWRLKQLVDRDRYDIVHSHASHAHGVAFLACRVLSPGGAHARRPLLVVSRRVDFPVARNRFSALKYRRGADVYLAISRGVQRVLETGGVSRDRIELVPSGIDLDKFGTIGDTGRLHEEFGIAEDTVVIGNIAALAPHKAQADFVRAAVHVKERYPGARFFIVGEGRLRGELERLIRKTGMSDSIVMTGFREDVYDLLSMFHCFVLSSRLEGLCTSIMDAQALGIPVVATETGGVPDVVEDGRTGLLAPPARPDLLAAAIVRMLSDQALQRACVSEARARSKRYDYRNMVRGTVGAYRKWIEKREGAR
jgi:glycosyltransferase involved in cell wall biosynthesis